MRKNRRLAGWIIVIVALVIAYLGVRQLGMFDTTNTYYVFYDDIQGLEQGAPVYIRGVNVGKVDKIKLNLKHKIKVVLELDKETRLPVGTVAMIVSGGLVGNRSIDLILSEDANTIEDGSELASAVDPEAKSVSALITPMVETGKILLYTADSTMRAMNMLSGVGMLRGVSRGVIFIDSQMESYRQLSESLNRQGGEMVNTLRDLNNMTGDPAVRNSNMNEDIRNARQKTAKLAAEPIVEDVKELRASIVTLGSAIKNVDSKDNAVGKMLNDKTLYKNATTAIDSLNATMETLKKDPPGFTILGK